MRKPEICSRWKCYEEAVIQDLYELPDGNTVWLYYCPKHIPERLKHNKEKQK